MSRAGRHIVVLAIMTSNSEIVISGISGRYPESLNMHEFWNRLLSGTELSSIDNRRWPLGESKESSDSAVHNVCNAPPGLYDLPERSGKVPEAGEI